MKNEEAQELSLFILEFAKSRQVLPGDLVKFLFLMVLHIYTLDNFTVEELRINLDIVLEEYKLMLLEKEGDQT